MASRASPSSEEYSSELSESVSESVTYRDSECNKDVGGNEYNKGAWVRTSKSSCFNIQFTQ